ncbi:MAG: gamma-glutamylcyclotransferase, partial [Hyphococcus sp.]
AAPAGAAALSGHVLKFHKIGADGSAKCDAFETPEDDARLHGVVYDLAPHEIPALDAIEGLGAGYEKKEVAVTLASGEVEAAFTYYATRISARLSPFCWYKTHVVRGALEHGLPARVVESLKTVSHVDDADAARVQKELSVYGPA